MALQFDVAKAKARAAAQLADMIRANGARLQAGLAGAPYLLHAPSRSGYIELA